MSLMCTYRDIGFFDEFFYSADVSRALISARGTNISSFIGKHKHGKNNRDVQGVFFHDTTVEFFPRGLAKAFPNLKAVVIKNCGLKSLYQEDFEGLQDLEIISIYNNPIHSLPSKLFSGMKKLRKIGFSNNKLKCLSPTMFDPLIEENLELVEFLRNPGVDEAFDRQSGDGSLAKLKEEIRTRCYQAEDPSFAQRFMSSVESLCVYRDENRFSDMIVIAGPAGATEEFHVHSLILSIQSDVFAAKIKSMKEQKTATLAINDFSSLEVEELLDFMYTGTVKEGSSPNLFYLAYHFNVGPLIKMLEKLAVENIDESNALKVYEMGSAMKFDSLKKAAFEVIKRMFPDRKLPETIIEKPESIRLLVQTYEQVQQVLAHVSFEGEPEDKKLKVEEAD